MNDEDMKMMSPIVTILDESYDIIIKKNILTKILALKMLNKIIATSIIRYNFIFSEKTWQMNNDLVLINMNIEWPATPR